MKLLRRLFSNPSNKFLLFFGALALIGFIDATYLALKYFLGGPIPCFVASGCDTVTASIYARLIGIPVALLGALYYLALLILILAYVDSGWKVLFLVALHATIIGFIMSVWFIFAQAFLLKAFCFYCLISGGTSTTLFVSSYWWLVRNKIPDTGIATNIL